MTTALDYMTLPDGPAQANALWYLRYVVLLWLSLICMIPFDLAQLDDPDRIGETATKIEAVAKMHLGKAGLEREGVASLLSRFYMRKDTRSRFHEFLIWAKTTLESSLDLFMVCERLTSTVFVRFHFRSFKSPLFVMYAGHRYSSSSLRNRQVWTFRRSPSQNSRVLRRNYRDRTK